MQGYTPLFHEVVDSSLWKEPLHVRVVFLTMLSLQDFDHVVRLPIHKIANKANVGDKLFLDAMKVLAEPDKLTTIEQPFEGRRIEKDDNGDWLILNGEFYQRLMRECNDRARWARQKREQRAKADAKEAARKNRDLAHKLAVVNDPVIRPTTALEINAVGNNNGEPEPTPTAPVSECKT